MRGAARGSVWLGLFFLVLPSWTPAESEERAPAILSVRDEFEVARALDAYAVYLVRREIDKLMAVFADDAAILSKAGKGMVSKAEFRKELERGMPQIRRLSITEVELRVESPRAATVVGTERCACGGEQRTERLLWRLEKRGEAWLIVEIRSARP